MKYALSLEVLKMPTTRVIGIMVLYNKSFIVDLLLRNKTRMKNYKYFYSKH